MTPEQLAALKLKINQYYDEVAAFVPPQFALFTTIGKIVANETPDLINDIEELWNKEDPTPEEEDALAVGIKQLLNPESA